MTSENTVADDITMKQLICKNAQRKTTEADTSQHLEKFEEAKNLPQFGTVLLVCPRMS